MRPSSSVAALPRLPTRVPSADRQKRPLYRDSVSAPSLSLLADRNEQLTDTIDRVASSEDERGERLAAEAAADEERELAVMAKLDVRAPLDALLS